eukprot:4587139-Amphidinium_carterae.2
MAVDSVHSWQEVVVSALNWMRKESTSFANVEPPTKHNLETWADVSRIMGGEFLFIIKAITKTSHLRLSRA